MSKSPIVGDASIVVRAITDKVKSDITKAFRDARPAIAAEGRAAGQEYGSGFHDGLNQGGGIGQVVSQSLGSSNVLRSARSAGGSIGGEVNRGIAGSLGDDRSGIAAAAANIGGEITHDVAQEVEKTGRVIDRAMTNTLQRAGRDGSSALGRALSTGFASSARAASTAFTSLLAVGNIIAPLVAQLVGGISALVSGLFALVSAAGQAAGALAVLPGILGVLLQSMGALKLAFSGVGGAISAGMKQATASTASTTSATVSATNAIADAQRALGRTTVSVAQANADAAGNVADAERNVLSAQQDVLAVQNELNDARKQAIEDLQQLSFSAEDAALAEQRAKLELQDAFTALQAVSNLPANDRARIDAELAFKEADLNFREAKDRNNDLAKEQAKAAKAGVDGSQAVLDKKNEINDAQQKLADSEQALADARVQQARTAVQGQQQIADAQRAVADAQQSAADALATGATAANAYQTALARLGPAQQDFVKSVVAMKSKFDALKQSVGQELFPKLTDSLKTITADVFPLLETQLGDTGGLLGDAAKEFTGVITSASGLSKLTTIMQDNNRTLSIFTKKGQDGDSAISELVKVILRLGVAIQPITHRFALWVKTLIDGADASTKGAKNMDQLRGFFHRAADTAAQLGRIFHNLFVALGNLAGAARPAGQGLLDSFEGATKSLDHLTKKASTSGELSRFFRNAAENTRQIGRTFNEIGAVFLSFGDNKGIGEFFDSLSPAIASLKQVGDQLTGSGDALADFINRLAAVIADLVQGGTISKMLSFFGFLLKILDKIIGNSFAQWVLIVAGSVAAFTRGFQFAVKILGFFGKAIIGEPLVALFRLDKTIQGTRKGTSLLQRTFAEFNANGLRAAFQLATEGSDQAKAAFERQMKTDQLKIEKLLQLQVQAEKTAGALIAVREAGLPATGAAAKAVKPAVPLTSAQTRGAVPIVPTTTTTTTATKLPRSESGSRPLPAVFGPGAAAASQKAIGQVTASTSKLTAGLAKTRAGIGRLGSGILGFAGGPIGLLLLSLPLLIVAFKKLYDSSSLIRGIFDALGAFFSNKAVILGFVGAVGLLGGVMIADAIATGAAGAAISAWAAESTIATVATAAWSAVTTIATGVMAAFNLVLEANPIALVVLAIAALAVGFVIAYKKSATFRRIVNGALGAVKTAAEFVFNFFKDHWPLLFVLILGPFALLLPVIIKHWGDITDAISGAVSFVIDFVKDHWKLLLTIIIGPLAFIVIEVKAHWDLIKGIFTAAFDVIVAIVKVGVDVITTVWDVLSGAIVGTAKLVWDGVKLYFKLLGGYVKLVFGAIKLVWQNVLKPVFDAIKTVVEFLWKNVIKPDLELIRSGWKTLWDAVKAVYQNVVKPVFDALKGIFDDLHDKVDTVVGFIVNRFDDVKGALTKVRDFFKETVQDIGGFISDIPGFIKAAFSQLASFAVDGINSFIDFINNGLIDSLNFLTKPFDLTIPHIPRVTAGGDGGGGGAAGRKHAEGGYITGPGTETSDSIPARLSRGEYVVRAKAVRQIGVAGMDALNRGRAAVTPQGRAMDFSSAGRVSVSAGLAGGRGGPIGDAFGWLKNAGFATLGLAVDQVKEWLKKGVGYALSKVIEAAEFALEKVGFDRSPDGDFHSVDNIFFGILDKLRDSAQSWGDDQTAALVALGGGSLFPGSLQGGVSLPIPAEDMFTSGYSYEGQYPLHSGVDLGAPYGTPVYAIADGFLRSLISLTDSYGNYIVSSFPGFDALYAHLRGFAPGLNAGSKVKAGQVLGWSDTTGNAAGAHLHFEIRRPGSSTTVDPLDFLRSIGLKFARGGVVPPTTGGMLGVIGEAGRPERVEPLDREGMSKRDKLILDTIRVAASSGGGGDTFQVFPSQGMSEVELAESVSRRVSFKRRTGT